MKNKKIIAIIPARGGSKGIKRKNIYPLANKPLIAHTIDAALKSKYITTSFVSSDDDEILEVSKQIGAEVLKRPDSLARDSSKTEDAILHLLEHVGGDYDYLVLLQPTSPLRTEKDIDLALEVLFANQEADGLISVKKPIHSPYKAFTIDGDNYLQGIVNNDYPFMPRQALPVTFYPNGAIYIMKVSVFLKNKKLFSEKVIPFEMDDIKSMDIDSLDELQEIQKIMSQ